MLYYDLAAIGAIIFWGMLPLLFLVTDEVPVFQKGLIIYGFAFIAVFFVKKIWRSNNFPRTRWAWGISMLCGLLLFMMQMGYFIAFNSAPASAAEMICYLWPILQIIALSFFEKRAMHTYHYQAISIAILAMLILFFPSMDSMVLQPKYYLGYLMSFMASVFWVIYTVICVKTSASDNYYLSAHLLFAMLFFLIGSLWFEEKAQISWFTMMALFIQGGLANGIAFILWTLGITRGHADLLTFLAHFVPVISLFLLSWSGYEGIAWYLYIVAFLLALAPTVIWKGETKKKASEL